MASKGWFRAGEAHGGHEEHTQHAFFMLGDRALFLAHMTMFAMDAHAYQMVLRCSLPEAEEERWRELRKSEPGETWVVGNQLRDGLILPEIHSGMRASFRADVFRGVDCKAYEHWPWEGVEPAIRDVEVAVERVVYYRHFDWNIGPPTYLTYVLFGEGDEAHMQNYQAKRVAPGDWAPKRECDHVLSLRSRPDWLLEPQLRAGVHVAFPSLPRDPIAPPSANPLQEGSEHKVLYFGRHPDIFGEEPERTVAIGRTWWFCDQIVNQGGG